MIAFPCVQQTSALIAAGTELVLQLALEGNVLLPQIKDKMLQEAFSAVIALILRHPCLSLMINMCSVSLCIGRLLHRDW